MIIYGLIDPLTLCLRYIGVTSRPQVRLKEHLTERGKCHRIYWLDQLKKAKLVPIFEVLAETDDLTWQDDERFLIGLFRALGADLVNDTDGGEGGTVGAIARARLSAAHKGKRLSESHRLAIGDAHRGRRLSESHRENLKKAAKLPKHLERLRQSAASMRAAKAKKRNG